MQEPGGLFGDGLDDLRMRVPRRAHGDTSVEVEEDVPVDVLNHGARPAGWHQPVGPGERGAGDAGVRFDELPGPGAGKLRLEVRLGEPGQLGRGEGGLRFQVSPR